MVFALCGGDERIARLAEKGVKPEEICAVTFTVRAAFFMWA